MFYKRSGPLMRCQTEITIAVGVNSALSYIRAAKRAVSPAAPLFNLGMINLSLPVSSLTLGFSLGTAHGRSEAALAKSWLRGHQVCAAQIAKLMKSSRLPKCSLAFVLHD